VTDNEQAMPSFPEPSAALQELGERLCGRWKVSGGAEGEVSYEWLEGGYFLVQRVDLRQHGMQIRGIEIIGNDRPFGSPPSEEITSRFFDNHGNTLDSVLELEGDLLTIWGGEKGSPAHYKGKLEGRKFSGAWVYPATAGTSRPRNGCPDRHATDSGEHRPRSGTARGGFAAGAVGGGRGAPGAPRAGTRLELATECGSDTEQAGTGGDGGSDEAAPEATAATDDVDQACRALPPCRRRGEPARAHHHRHRTRAARPDPRSGQPRRDHSPATGVTHGDLSESACVAPQQAPRIDANALATLGTDFETVGERLEATFGPGALERTRSGSMPVMPRLKAALAHALDLAGDQPVEDEHVLLGLLSVRDSLAAHLLAECGVSLADVQAVVRAE
jgi:hypothetical protein